MKEVNGARKCAGAKKQRLANAHADMSRATGECDRLFREEERSPASLGADARTFFAPKRTCAFIILLRGASRATKSSNDEENEIKRTEKTPSSRYSGGVCSDRHEWVGNCGVEDVNAARRPSGAKKNAA